MGITFAKLFQRLFSKKEMRILMVRDVLRSRDGFGREERAVWIGRFFFSIFFFFPRKNQGTTALCILNRGVWRERERPGIFLPERGLDATRLRGQKVFDYMRLYLSNVSIDRVGLEEKRRRSKPNNNSVRLRGRAAKILVHFYDTSRPFFFTRERELFSITDQNFVYIFVNSTGWSRCRR